MLPHSLGGPTRSAAAAALVLCGMLFAQGQSPVPPSGVTAELNFISYGIPEKGDARWLDQQGSFMATVAAQPVFILLGAQGMGVTESYQTARMPVVNSSRLLGGRLAWRQHDGGHTDAPNVRYVLAWADRWIGHTRPVQVLPR